VTLEFVSILTLRKDLNAIVMLTSWATGVPPLVMSILAPLSPAVDGLYSMLDVPSFGLPNFKCRLPCPPLKLSILPCLRLFVMFFPSWNYLIKEMKEHNIPVICTKPYVYCKVFEDNSGALELAGLPKRCPRTKHINVCYHHF
jgi:hypothetical protein